MHDPSSLAIEYHHLLRLMSAAAGPNGWNVSRCCSSTAISTAAVAAAADAQHSSHQLLLLCTLYENAFVQDTSTAHPDNLLLQQLVQQQQQRFCMHTTGSGQQAQGLANAHSLDACSSANILNDD
jgi:hypothetical protein